ncbi:MAG: hypothetical protein WC376_04625 [Candidatus Nanoarchaeia archaeon]|jgi:hypothetical protein
MKKADIEIENSVELILIIVGLILLIILVSAILLNIESLGNYLKTSIGELF